MPGELRNFTRDKINGPTRNDALAAAEDDESRAEKIAEITAREAV